MAVAVAVGVGLARCPHCGTAVEGVEDSFCCGGCESAYAIIRGAGLERYYAEREAFAPRPEPVTEGWSAVSTTTCPDGSEEARLVVDGLRCASCVWLVERVLEDAPGVRAATVSYATGRASLLTEMHRRGSAWVMRGTSAPPRACPPARS